MATSTTNQNEIKKANVKRRGGDRINDDWQYLNEGEVIYNPTTDQSFNQQQYKHQGLGTTSISKSNLIKEEEEERVETERQINQINQINKVKAVNERQIIEQRQHSTKRQKEKKRKKVKRQVFATIRNVQLIIGFIPFYLIQLQLAFISAIGMGLITLGSTASDYLFENNLTLLGKAINWVTTNILSDFNSILGHFTGVSASDLAAELFMIPFFIILAINLIFICIVYITHKMAFRNPIFGEQGGAAKPIAFIIYLIGLFPVLNIFPFFLVWLLTIQKYPK